MSYYLLNRTVLFDSLTGKIVFTGNKKSKQLRSNEWKLLQLFVSREGQDITSDEILQSIWQNKRARSSVTTSIKNLRAQLEDGAHQPRYIQTQVMTGYVFIASVKPLTKSEYDQAIRANDTVTSTLKRNLKKHRKVCTLCIINVISLATIIFSIRLLYMSGAFEFISTTSESHSIVPMVIQTEQNELSNQSIYNICNALAIDAQQISKLLFLPITQENPRPNSPSLTWANESKEMLICHMPSTKPSP